MPLLFILFGIILYIYGELSLLVSVGSYLGVFPTILLLIAISALGLWFVKLRGLYTMYSIRKELSEGKLPAESLMSSVLFVFAGILLIIPGFLSDILAILCVLPFTRKMMMVMLGRIFKKRVSFMQFGGYQTSQAKDDTIIDAEFERQQDQDKWIK